MRSVTNQDSIRNGESQSQRHAVSIAPHPALSRYYGEGEGRQNFLNELFDRTASHYRSVDRVAGFGYGLWYRRRSLLAAGLKSGMRMLDVACGPGLMAQCARNIIGPSGSVVGLDPSIGMLREAQKISCGKVVRGVGEQLPFPSATFDFLSMGYAVRHVSDLTATFVEYRRVLKPGGILLLLDVCRPRSLLLLSVSRFYIKTVLGLVFAASTRNRDMKTLMEYWWDTTESCVPSETILGSLKEAGFVDCSSHELFDGLLRDYCGSKAGQHV